MNEPRNEPVAPTTSRLEDRVRTLTERVAQLKGELAQALARVAALTTIDHATGLLVWPAFAERARGEIARATRYQREMGLVVLATDGSLSLAELSEICRSKYRECDVAGHTDAGEIALLLPETSLEGAFVIGERIRAQAIKSRGSAPTLGCAAWPRHGRTLTALLSSARNPLRVP
jgi:GGDEF domain-containing protein